MMETEIVSRRNMLRGSLAVGCSLLLPGVLSGCDSRQGNQPTTDAAPANPPAMGVDPAAPATNSKVSQESVQYQATPKGELKCSDCMHFVAATSTCKLVEGQISPEGWCSLWAMKT